MSKTSELVERTVPMRRGMPFEYYVSPEPNSGCHLWMGADNGKGYGRVGQISAHRIAYEMAKGPIPEGMVIDHLCRNTMCVNPDHLEAVTAVENTMRGNGVGAVNAAKTHCARGHEYAGENLVLNKNGTRACRKCIAIASKKYWAKKKAAQPTYPKVAKPKAKDIPDLLEKIERQAKAIEELGGAFQKLGLMLVSEAAGASRPGQMESLEALADDAFLRARQAASHSKGGE